ncbi:Crp/Fnr family transcriptional regulator [Gammaproteobacteria bacterium]|nr:Crp/Fnr family transcriptional regulator [Gammaproteobacteria bacterium]
MDVTQELLKNFPILKALTDKDLENLARYSVIRKFRRREIVLAAGKREENLCFLFEGRLQGVDFTIDGREVGLYFVEPGEFCGELSLFDDEAQVEHVIALTPIVAVSIPVEKIRAVMLANSTMLDFLSKKLTARIREMTFQRSLLALPNIEQRVCCQLWILIDSKDKRSSEKCEIQNPPTHLELAIMLNVSRETVSRVFQNLQNQEIVRRSGITKLEILKKQQLKNLAEGLHAM